MAILGIGLGMLMGVIVLLLVLANAFGVFLMIAGFLVTGAVTGLFQGGQYRGRGSYTLNRARRIEESRRRKRLSD